MSSQLPITPPLLSENSQHEWGGIDQCVSSHQMLGSIYSPGKIDEMIATNPVVQLGWLGLSAAMSSAQIELVPCGCKDDVFDFVNEMLFKRLNTRFQEVFLSALDALLYGCAAFECSISWQQGRYWLKDLSARPIRGFDLYNISRKPGEWWINGKYSWYTASGALKSADCGSPSEEGKALIWWLTWGPGLLGRSLLRPIVNESETKNLIRRLRTTAMAKSLFGTPVLHARKRDQDENELNPRDIEAAQSALAKASTGRAACLYIPDDFDMPEIQFADSNALAGSVNLENALDIQTLMALGSAGQARGLLAGYGTQASSDGDSALQDSIRQYFFQWFSSQIQNLIDYFIDINFGDQAYYPELRIVSPSAQTPSQLSRTVTQLVGCGVIRPCDADENWMRKLLRMPEQNGNLLQSTVQEPSTGLGISGHYDPMGDDSRVDRDVARIENKQEL